MSYWITATITPTHDVVKLKIPPHLIEELARLNGVYLDVDAVEINGNWILKSMYVEQNHLPIHKLLRIVLNIVDNAVYIRIVDEDGEVLHDSIEVPKPQIHYVIVEGDKIVEVIDAISLKHYLQKRGKKPEEMILICEI